jgi:orotate phosphoribosyltransferase
MKEYQKEFARLLAESGALFFDKGLRLKDGRPTPYFVNIGLFHTGRYSSLLGSFLAQMIVSLGLADQTDILVGPSYKGSAIAVATSQALWLNHDRDILFEYDRKEAKTHGEATKRASMFVTNALFPGARILILDDVGTTMGTKYAILNLIKEESSARNLDLSVIGVGLTIDREQTTVILDEDGRPREGVKGDDAIAKFTAKTGLPVHFLAGIRDVVNYLTEEKIPVQNRGSKTPLDPDTLREFEVYMDTYGVPSR